MLARATDTQFASIITASFHSQATTMRGLRRGEIKRNYFASLNYSVESAQFSKSLTRSSHYPSYGRRVYAEMHCNPAYGRRPLSPGVVGYILNVYRGLP